jgi:hypothetical protein
MLDVLGIKGGDDTDAYIEALAWSLAEVWPEGWESHDMHWIPVPALAAAIKQIWKEPDFWNHFGGTRRPPIPEVIERCKDYRRNLVGVERNIWKLGCIWKRLDQIIDTVNEYDKDEW